MSISDPWAVYATDLASIVRNLAAITPADDTDLAVVTRALWVGGTGNVRVTTIGGQTETIVGASGLIPVSVRRVLATGTTATSILALW